MKSTEILIQFDFINLMLLHENFDGDDTIITDHKYDTGSGLFHSLVVIPEHSKVAVIHNPTLLMMESVGLR